MENLSVSKIHKLIKTDKPLSQFVNEEKQLFDAKKRDGRSSKLLQGMNFETFLNHRHQKHLGISSDLNADAKKSKPVMDLLKQTAEKLKAQPPDPMVTTIIPKPTAVKKTILGMNPIVFYSATGAVLLVTGLLIYKMVKKRV